MNEFIYNKITLWKEDFDLVRPSQAVIQPMMKNNLVQPILRNLGSSAAFFNNVSPFIRHRLDPFSVPGMKAENYVVPYMWGTSGILYNTKLVSSEEVNSWACAWIPENKGKMLMKDSYWGVYNIASIYGNYPAIAADKRTIEQVANDHTSEDMTLVEEKIKQMRPYLAGWEADFGKDMMTKG